MFKILKLLLTALKIENVTLLQSHQPSQHAPSPLEPSILHSEALGYISFPLHSMPFHTYCISQAVLSAWHVPGPPLHLANISNSKILLRLSHPGLISGPSAEVSDLPQCWHFCLDYVTLLRTALNS